MGYLQSIGEANFKNLNLYLKGKRYINDRVNLIGDKLITYRIK